MQHLIDAKGKRNHVRHCLERLRTMQESVRGKQERIARLEVLMDGLKTVIGESVSGGERRDIAEAAHELDVLRDEYEGDLQRYAHEIATGYLLCPVENIPRYVCWLHWAEGMTWAQVADKVGYDRETVRDSICDKGACEIYDEMPHHWREDIPEAI